MDPMGFLPFMRKNSLYSELRSLKAEINQVTLRVILIKTPSTTKSSGKCSRIYCATASQSVTSQSFYDSISVVPLWMFSRVIKLGEMQSTTPSLLLYNKFNTFPIKD